MHLLPQEKTRINRMRPVLQFVISIAGIFIPQLQTASDVFSHEGVGTFLEGLQVCQQINASLVTFLDKFDNDEVLSDFARSGEHFWIGLYDNMSSWTWSLDEAAFDNGTDFSSWDLYEPQLSVLAKICVLMSPQGFWFDELCTETRPAVCYYGPGPAQYILVNTSMTWERAQQYCRYNYTDLASVRNLTENTNISTLLTEPSWIGLFREGWGQWADNTLRNFTNFPSQDLARNQTSSIHLNCARADSSTGLWSNVSCESNNSILCYTKDKTNKSPRKPSDDEEREETSPMAVTIASGSKNTLRLNLQSGTDLNDPRVQDEILHKLHSQLDNGSFELKLSWVRTNGQVFHKKTTKKKSQDC